MERVNMNFYREVRILSDISMKLLQKLDSEPKFVKKFIEEECERLKEERWKEKDEERLWIKIFEREKYILRIAFIHARKGEHITGADLVVELKNKKIIFIQSKRVGTNGRIYFNRFQLQKLIELERQICGFLPFSYFYTITPGQITHVYYISSKLKEYTKDIKLLPMAILTAYHSPSRVAFYHLIMTDKNNVEERFFHASEILFTLGGNKSISQREFLNQGLNFNEFHKMFWECRIGGPDIDEDMKRDILYFYSLLTNRFLIRLNIEER